MCVNNASDNIAGCNNSVIISISLLISLVMDQREKLRHSGVNAEYAQYSSEVTSHLLATLRSSLEILTLHTLVLMHPM